MPQPTISSFSRICGLGVFKEFVGDATTTFRRWNLVYGFNGTGKTTLSRVLASIAAEQRHPLLPQDGAFAVELTDGTRIESPNLSGNPLSRRLFVFNADFVDENLRWKEGTSSPIFYLGRDQADLATRLTEIQERLDRLDRDLSEAKRLQAAEDRAFSEAKRATARTIASHLNLGRQYEAPDLVRDYESADFESSRVLGSDELQQARAIIAMESHLPKLRNAEKPASGMTAVFADVRRIVSTTVGAIVLEELREHEQMLGWVNQGLSYHTTQGLSSCLFCGSPLRSERLSALRLSLDERFELLINEIRQITERVSEAQRSIIRLKEANPSQNDVMPSIRGEYERRRARHKELFLIAERALGRALSVLADKAAWPNRTQGLDRLLDERTASDWDRESTKCIEAIDEIATLHNTAHDNFATFQQTARGQLKGHYLSADREGYRVHVAQVDSANERVRAIELERQALEAEIAELNAAIRRLAPAAEAINKLLRNYLGRSHIEFLPSDNAFEIHRGGTSMTGALSEGEKTAIALCYFLASLEGEGRRTGNLIVVVDDPISSLDTNALNYAFNMIKGLLGNAGQLIIMTHNLHFMNEAKKWFKNRAREEEGRPATASLLFLNAVQDSNGILTSSIIALPRLIRDYDSEYQHLFGLVCQFANQPAEYGGYFYLLPNALRKILEVFLAFHLPGPEGLANKVATVSQSRPNLDAAEVAALERLVHVESHGDSIEDLVALSSMTIEETHRAISALFKVMQEMSPEHLLRMQRLSARSNL